MSGDFEKPTDAGKLPAGIVPRAEHGKLLQGSVMHGSINTSAMKKRSGSMLGEILLKNGDVTQDAFDKAIAVQEERGGQLGRILVSTGACSESAIARALVEQLKVRKKKGTEDDLSTAARANPDVAGIRVLCKPTLTTLTLFFVDALSCSLAAAITLPIDRIRSGYWHLQEFYVFGPSIILCMTVFLFLELYSPLAKSTPDELRNVVLATSIVHVAIGSMALSGALPLSRWGLFARLVWWAATVTLVPFIRALVRSRLSPYGWWGIPVIVLGAAKTGRLIVRTLKAQPRSGLKPVALLDDDAVKHGTLHASFTNEMVDLRSMSISASHFMSESTRKALADELLGPESEPPSSSPNALMTSAPPAVLNVSSVPPALNLSSVPPALNVSSVPPALNVSSVPPAIVGSSRPPSAPPSSAAPPSSGTPPMREKADSVEDQFYGPESTRIALQPKVSSWFPRGRFAEVEGVPLVGDLALAPVLAKRLKIPYAICAMPGVESRKLLEIIERVGGMFSHLLVIPDLFGFATLGVPAKSLGGILGVEVRQQLLLPWPRFVKRVFDITLTSLGGICVLPFLLVLAVLIKLDSRGPVLYWQRRLGVDGEHFMAAKFRSMHGDGEDRLQKVLDSDPELRAEYEVYHKLRKDPRVTRLGRILRKFSLDEFPQLWNVIKGDMSLVGPRPYIERELPEMTGQEKIILRATPGMTGMWQVSDRNAASFAWRVQVDVHYVRNWSPWLDVYILAKTFGVVVKGSGV